MKVVSALLFAGLATWSGLRNAWAVPGFALLAAAQLAMPIAVWRRWDGRAALAALEVSLGLTHVGLAYFLSGFVGRPTTWAFWAVFAAAVAIFGPVYWLLHTSTFGKQAEKA